MANQKEVIAVLKSEGMDIAEDMAVQAVKSAFKILILLAPKVSQTAGAIIAPMLAVLEPRILELLDKIDGEDDPEY